MVSNSRTKLRMKLLNVEKRDNIEFYLCCKFQCSPFSVHCKTDVTDGMTNELPYAVAPPLGINIHHSSETEDTQYELAISASELGTMVLSTGIGTSVGSTCTLTQ